MITPTTAALDAACKAARKAIEDYSPFYSGMVPDDALEKVVAAALTAAINVPQPRKGPSP